VSVRGPPCPEADLDHHRPDPWGEGRGLPHARKRRSPQQVPGPAPSRTTRSQGGSGMKQPLTLMNRNPGAPPGEEG